jgi:hypothetical protein
LEDGRTIADYNIQVGFLFIGRIILKERINFAFGAETERRSRKYGK